MTTTDICRRSFLRHGFGGLGMIALNSLLSPKAFAQSIASKGVVNPLHHAAKAKRVIFLYQAGGPSHLETFDYKPELAKLDGKPMPESLTVMTSLSPSSSLALMPTPPEGVNLMALPQRFSRTWRSRRSSPRICEGMRMEMKLEISMPLAWARGASSSVTDSISAARSKGSFETSRF